jgi:acetyl esterase/lipase
MKTYREARRAGAFLPQPLAVSAIAADGEVGGIPVRVFTPPAARATYLHLHGGGFVYGGARLQDARLEAIALACEARVVSVEYRLAPEHPYPAAPDDCEAVATTLAREGGALVIGGESAGANLAVVTLARLRDRGLTPFRAAVLVAGFYDLSRVDPELTELVEQYAPTGDDALHIDLRGLPEALFISGSADPLLDDSVRLAGRWPGAELLVLEDEPHDLDATGHVIEFLRRVL